MSNPTRAYDSEKRTAAAEARRTEILAVTQRMLAEAPQSSAVTLQAVAKAAGVNRLTIYNQFGSRRGLLEAVFDERMASGGLPRLREAMDLTNPWASLREIVEIFSAFWGAEGAMANLHAEAGADPELAEAFGERNERRRTLFMNLAPRLMPDADDGRRQAAADLLFVMTAQATYAGLRVGRDREATCALLVSTCEAMVRAV